MKNKPKTIDMTKSSNFLHSVTLEAAQTNPEELNSVLMQTVSLYSY